MKSSCVVMTETEPTLFVEFDQALYRQVQSYIHEEGLSDAKEMVDPYVKMMINPFAKIVEH